MDLLNDGKSRCWYMHIPVNLSMVLYLGSWMVSGVVVKVVCVL